MSDKTKIREHDASSLGRHLLLFLIIAFGAFLRFGAVHDTKVIAPLRSDAGQYVAYAMNSLYHGVYSRQPYNPQAAPDPDAVRPPVYPLFLAVVFSTSPRLPVVLVQYLQAIIGTVTILLAYLLFSRFLAPVPAYISTFLVAISPHLVLSNVYILTESVFTFGLLASLLLCVYAYEKGGKTLAFLAGLVFGVLTLTRSAVQYFIIVAAALLRWRGKSRGFVALVVLGFLIVFGAWSARNIHATGHMADNTLMIKFLSHGMYPDFEYKGQQDTYGFPYRYDPNSSSIESSTASVLTAMLNRFLEEPIRHLRWFILGKPMVFWQWNIIQGMGGAYVYPVKASPYVSRPLFRWTHFLSKILHAPLVILGLLGCIFCWLPASTFATRSMEFCVKLIASLLIYYQIVHMIGAPFPRYSVPLQPLIYGMAMYFLWGACAWMRARRGGTGTSAAGGHP